MFAGAPFSPASLPAITPLSPPVADITPPPLLEPAAPPPFPTPPSLPSVSPVHSAPPVPSPATPSPPPLPLTVPPPPTNSAPPVNPPVIQVPPAFPSPPKPEIPLVPASSPPITSNENPIPVKPPPPPPPANLNPPAAVAFPSPANPASSPPPLSLRHRKVAPGPPAPTATFPPPAFWPPAPETISPPPATVSPFTEPPLSSWTAAAPSSPTAPEFSPKAKLPPLLPANIPAPPSSGSLPVAVEIEKHSGFNMSSGLIVGIAIGGIVFVFVVAVVLVLCRNSKKKKQKNLHTRQLEEPSPCVGSKGSHVTRVLSNPPHLTEGCGAFGSVNSGDVTAIPNHAAASIAFGSVNGISTYDELVVATNCFSEANLLGEGGFGYVYKGVLPSGKEIAVKQLKAGSQQGEREFQAEVETISRVHHKHLVELVGYCITRADRLLVYEFVPNNTLEFHLHGEGKPVVEWEKRIKIALGSAKGLAYLHEDCNPAIIHRDIKASNILLDFSFEAKVSDFGLAKIFPNTDGCITHLTTRVVGTFGYLAPEYASSGKLTDKSDVYSYGVMLLELITGRPPITTAGLRNESLVDWARPLLAQALKDGNFNNLVDPRLQNNYEADEMARMITCAAACVRHSARLRPRMSQIAGALEGLVSLSDLVGDITPGHTTLHNWSDSSNYDACRYHQDLRNFNLALSSQQYNSSGHSESTSAYGLHLSDSSCEVQQTSQEI